MTISSASWADALNIAISKFFEQGFGRRVALLAALFNVQNSTSDKEQVGSVGAVGVEAWEAYEQSGQVGSAGFDQGYKTTYTHKEYPMELTIKKKLFEDSQHNQIFRLAARMGDSAALKREVDAASVFNNARSGSFLGADGVSLVNNSHPLSPHKTGTTQDNSGTLSLTATNVAVVREAMMAFTDDNESLVAVRPNLILVPPGLQDEALVITGSDKDPASANNALNPQSGRFEVLTWHYLTDSNEWFMIDTSLMKQSLDWFNRSPLSIVPKVEDKTIEATWIAYMRYSFGWSDWRWIYGNDPS